MPEIILDFGNALIKYFQPSTRRWGQFRHASSKLDDTQWRQYAGRGRLLDGMLRVNGQAYAIDEQALNYTMREYPKGAARYHKSYLAPFVAHMLSQLFDRSTGNIVVVASHAPHDIDYTDNLKVALMGEWCVESPKGRMTFEVTGVRTYDEPLGGFSHVLFTDAGEERKRHPLQGMDTLVLDIGGHTIDCAGINAYGEITALSLQSNTQSGVIRMMKSFESSLRSNNRKEFTDVGNINPRRLENAMMTGVYQMGRLAIPCAEESNQVRTRLVNDVVAILKDADVTNYDVILGTGGGFGLIGELLVVAYPNGMFIPAEEDMQIIQYANVFGGAKLFTYLKRNGVWK